MSQIEQLQFAGIKILVIGDIMLDHYLFGEINRISPEAPVPIVDVDTEESRLGGAANVALNIFELGAKVNLLSVIGEDEGADTILSLMKKSGLKSNSVLQSKLRKTTIKTRIFDDDRQVARFDKEDDEDLPKELEEKVIAEFNELIKNERFDVIILQDYNKGVLTKKIIKHILLITTKLSIPVVVDPKEYNFFEYQQIDLFKPNIKELSTALKHKIDPKNINSLNKAAEELRKRNRFDNLLVTLGAYGIYVCTQSGESFIVPARSIKTADVCGAGDTVVAIAALAYAKKLSFKKIAQISNLAAAKVCRKVGVVPVRLKDLK